MSFTKKLATASFLLMSTTAMAADTPPNHRLPPVAPPSINSRNEKDRLPLLMLRLYDLNRDQYDEKLEVTGLRPKRKLHTDKTELYADITDADEVKKTAKEFGLDEKQVKKITVKGDGVLDNYYFMTEMGAVCATATATQLELARPVDGRQERTKRVFWTTHDEGSQKVLFGYKEAESSKAVPAKWHTIEVAYDDGKKAFTTTHKSNANVAEKLGVHLVADVEKQLSVTSKGSTTFGASR